jgi:hypothetical protein
MMFVSASILLLTAASPQAATDITPASLATRPPVVNFVGTPYDWMLQQGRAASGQQVADSTANCNTCCLSTNRGGKTDQVHDCGFD